MKAANAAELAHMLLTDPEYAADWDLALARSRQYDQMPPRPRPSLPVPVESEGWSWRCRWIIEQANETAIDGGYDDEPMEVDRDLVISAGGHLVADHPDLTTDEVLDAIREALRFAGLE